MVFYRHFGLFSKPLVTPTTIVILFCLSIGIAQGGGELEYKIKAAYLYNFTKFINWPEKNTATFNICIVGDDPFNGLLDSLENKTAQNKPIRVFRYDGISQTKDCHIVYSDLPSPQLTSLALGCLSVSSQEFFAESGGMIGFALEDEKIKLHINLEALRHNGLGISAKLIEVATLVEGDGHE